MEGGSSFFRPIWPGSDPLHIGPYMTFSRTLLPSALFILASFHATVGAQAPGSPRASTSAQSVQSGDIVRLRIWREPDLSGDFSVDPAGAVNFPKLGEVQVAGESPEALKQTLVRRYQEYLRNPSIDVVVLKRVNVLGAVKNPGLYPVDATMTLADAVALAGGATPDGNRREVRLIRDGAEIAARLDDRVRIADLPLRSGDQLFVPERRWVSRNPGIIAASISALASIVIAIALR